MIVHVNLLSVKIIDKQLADHRKQNEREKVAMPNRVHVNLKEDERKYNNEACITEFPGIPKSSYLKKYNDHMLLRNAYQEY